MVIELNKKKKHGTSHWWQRKKKQDKTVFNQDQEDSGIKGKLNQQDTKEH